MPSASPPDRSATPVHTLLHAERHLCIDKLEWLLPQAHTLVWVESGMGTLTVNGKRFSLSAGACFYAWPGMEVAAAPFFNETVLYTLTFERLTGRAAEADQISYTRSAHGFAGWGELTLPAGDRLLALARELAQKSSAEGERPAARRSYLFHTLMYELTVANEPHPLQDGSTDQIIHEIMQYIQVNYAKPLKRSVLAQMAGLAPEYFSLRFKQVSGLSLTDYIAALRIRHLQERLLFDETRLHIAAREVGYRDEHYASRRFKQEVGLSPTSYAQAPKRILSLNPHLTLHLLALGIMPVATVSYPWGFGDYEHQLRDGGCVCRDWTTAFTDEELAALQPELIIGIDDLEPERVQAYRRLAPTLVIPWYGQDWRGHLARLARVTRRTEQAQSWLASFDQRCFALREQLQALDILRQSLLIVNIRDASSFIYCHRGMGTQLVYHELGWAMPLALQQLDLAGAPLPIAPEQILQRFRAEHVILITEPSPQAVARTETMLYDSRWESCRSQGMRIHTAAMSRWHGYDPLSILSQLQDLETWFDFSLS
ncbi:hypothetical protein PA598K_03277 [Paenibacillus sp. 598K]|nr:hypothetical protein PA598K_03277 [Paenibacillus sp. 598K]